MNKVILIGRVGQEPESKSVGDSTVTKFSLATSESYKNKSGEKVEDTTWHNIEIWGKLAEVADKYVKKGDKLMVEGKIKVDQYEDKDGVKKTATKIRVESMEMLGGKQDSTTPKAEQAHTPKQEYSGPSSEDDSDKLPF